jgi:acyl dehydratase
MRIVKKDELDEFIGHEGAPTPWFTVTQEQINTFADATHDHQFIHVDEEKAKQTPFGGTIAHGFLTLSMLSHFAEHNDWQIEGAFMGMNYGFDKIRFVNPVKVNSRIRAVTKVLDITEKKPGQFFIRISLDVEIEGDEKPALTSEWLNMVFAN